MANLKEIRLRIAGVKSTRQITSAMKMVAAAKLRKAQDAILQMRPYANKLNEIFENLSSFLDNKNESIYAQQREIKKVLLILITSNKGLCGAFNSNVARGIILAINEKYKDFYDQGNLNIIAFGKKGADILKSKGYTISKSYHEVVDKPQYEQVELFINEILNNFAKEEYDVVELFYNQFRNAASQIYVQEQFLPVMKSEKTDTQFETNSDYILEPSRENIINELIPKSLKIQFFRALLDSVASEHGARMTAMHKATDNASDLIKEFQLYYNKARQAVITKEILEIVGGAEALKG